MDDLNGDLSIRPSPARHGGWWTPLAGAATSLNPPDGRRQWADRQGPAAHRAHPALCGGAGDGRLLADEHMDDARVLRCHAERMNAIRRARWGAGISGMKERPWRFISLCDHYGLLPVFLKDLEDLKSVPDDGRTFFSNHVMATLSVIEKAPADQNHAGRVFILAGLFIESAPGR